MTLGLIALGLFMGAVMSIYIPLISQSARVLGMAAMANVPFFFIAFVTSVVIAVGSGARGEHFARIPQVPLWQLSAGVMSAGMILGSVFLIPRVGIGAFFILAVSGQVLAGMLFSQLGLFGAPQTDITLAKVAGVGLVIAGVWLTTFR
jgi:transporter family-2 protein